MRESRAKLEAALGSMTDAVFISDSEGRFIEFNDAFATYHRFKNKAECSKTFAEYPDILDVFLADGMLAPLDMWAVPRALRGETATNAEYTLRRKDTGETWVGSYSFGPIRDKDGAIVGSVVVGRDITERKQAEERIRASLAEKEVLLKEIHHRVKNNMQVISSLVALQAERLPDAAMRAVLQDVTHRVRSMALVHEKLYQSADMARVEFAEYAQSLLNYLWRAHGTAASGVRLALDLEPVPLSVNAAVPCGLILNELASNALKHAFRGRATAAKWPCRFAAARRAGCASACATTARGCRRGSTGGRPTPWACAWCRCSPDNSMPPWKSPAVKEPSLRSRLADRRPWNMETMSKTTILIVEDEGDRRRGPGRQAGAARLRGRRDRRARRRGRRPGLPSPAAPRADGHLAGGPDGRHRSGGSDPPPARRAGDLPDGPFSDPATLARAKLTGPFGYILKPFEERDLATQIEMALYRHQADRQLRQQREWLRVTLTSIGDAVIATDAEGRITFVNPVAESLTGWKAEEAAGQPIQCVFRIVNEQTGQPLEEPVARVLREGRAVELANHAALVTKDGRTVPIEDSAAPILDAAGQVIGAVLVFHDVTEKRRAEEQLRRAATVRTKVTSTRAAALAWHGGSAGGQGHAAVPRRAGYAAGLRGVAAPDYHVPFANRFFEERFGKSEGRRCYEYLFSRTEPCENCETYKVLRPDDRTVGSGPVRTSRNYDIYDFPCHRRRRHAPRIMEVGLDITEIKRAQTALQRGQRSLERRVAEHSRQHRVPARSDEPTGRRSTMAVRDLDVERRSWSRTWCERRAAAADRHESARSDRRGCSKPNARRAGSSVDGCHSTRETGRALSPCRPRSPYLDAIALIGRAGRPSGRTIVGRRACIDITERKRAEEALRKSEQEFRALAEAVPQIVWATRPDGWNIYFNQQWMDYTGLTLDESYGHGWITPFHPDDKQRAWDAWQRATQHNETYLLECRLRRADGVYRWWLIHGTPIRGANGEIQKWLGTCTDIEELKQAEEALQQAKAAAEAANEAKSQFLANMSHELRTPMNAILGMIDVALPKATDPTVQDCLQTAKGSADLLLTLLNDLLDSAKIESGKLELESAPFSLRRMLDQITRVLAVRASEKGLCFYCRMPDETPDAVVGDRMRLQQVLLNLAGNAIKFTERGDVEISLHALSQDGEACLEFAVRDTGIGIPPSGLERLFQPFAQADASMARRFGGTGLGLSI